MVDPRTAEFSSKFSCNRSIIWGNSLILETLYNGTISATFRSNVNIRQAWQCITGQIIMIDIEHVLQS